MPKRAQKGLTPLCPDIMNPGSFWSNFRGSLHKRLPFPVLFFKKVQRILIFQADAGLGSIGNRILGEIGATCTHIIRTVPIYRAADGNRAAAGFAATLTDAV